MPLTRQHACRHDKKGQLKAQLTAHQGLKPKQFGGLAHCEGIVIQQGTMSRKQLSECSRKQTLHQRLTVTDDSKDNERKGPKPQKGRLSGTLKSFHDANIKIKTSLDGKVVARFRD
jgi:hypothetical protein